MYLTILLPCLNEEKSVGFCIQQASNFLHSYRVDGEVLVVDNGSIDDSINIAMECGARLVQEPNTGYGNALQRGISEAKGEFIIMADCDGSYDLSNLMPFIEQFENGYDFVCGNRFSGGIEYGAMPLSHRIGVPFLSLLGKVKYHVPINDFHCGLRGFRSDIAKQCDFESSGMEFATEIIYKFKNTKVIEIPIVLHKDLRNGKSHLSTFKDGLKHLKFIMESEV